VVDSGREIIWSVVDGEAMLLNAVSGEYFSLNGTGTEVWQRLQDGTSEAEIVESMARIYGVEASGIQRDVADLIAELRSAQLWP
jgi:Coenzyme PQQ synthesis protein D (PqqD)